MYVTRLKVSGVRGFDGPRAVDIELPKRPDGSYAGWTVLAGRNGSGKTTLLQAAIVALCGPYRMSELTVPEMWLPNSSEMQSAEIRAGFAGPDRCASKWPRQGELGIDWRYIKRGSGAGQGGPAKVVPSWDAASLPRNSDGAVDVTPDGGPWDSQMNEWVILGYGPFRRHSTAEISVIAQERPLRTSGWQTLFDEDATLVEGVSWLVGQRLRSLEGKPGASELVDVVLRLLGDGLLPDGFRVARVDSEGLWVRRGDGSEAPLRRMSDGYRTVGALVVDIVRRMHASFGTLEIEERDGVPTLPYPGVVLIDEVDAHLHVSWQKKIGGWLKTHFPKIQFIVTTHSPYICQSADPGGLIRLPGPDEQEPPRVVDEDLYHRVVYGSGDDAVLSELFGVETPYSAEAERLRRRLGDLEARVLDGQATEAEVEEFRALREILTSSLMARVDEVSARLGHER
ncbi:AAA family ATPase [Spirillospora sp. NPDC052269]